MKEVSFSTAASDRWFEDYEVGGTYQLGSFSLSEAEIVEFAQRFDPQPFHIDPDAARALERYARRLAKSLASVINVLDPDVIVLGGGLSNIDWLYGAVPAQWGKYVFSDSVTTRLLRNEHGDASGVRGAAWLWPNRT